MTQTVTMASTDFIGRAAELDTLYHQLSQPDGRLLTLIGSEGVGRTSLALAVGREAASLFPDGVYHIPLAQLDNAKIGDSFHPIATAIAQVLDFVFYGQRGSGRQLLAHLRGKETLLILDDFDRLPDGREFIAAILEETTGVKLIVVGREPVDLPGEWLYPVRGLAAPPIHAGDWASYDAAQLFQQTAAQQQRTIDLDAEKDDLIRFCQLVDGSPLALQMAAASGAPLVAINEAIAAATISWDGLLTFLWQNRPAAAQRALTTLSLFRGGFTAEAAAQTAEADANLLAEGVGQYWLVADQEGRYQWRNRPQQYALCQLDHFDPDAARDQHAAYYAQRLERLWLIMRGAGFLTAVNQIKREIDNIRAAWQWAVRRRQFDWLNQMMAPLWLFYAENEWIVEGLDRFGWATAELADAAATPAQQIAHNQLLAHQAWFYHLKDENKTGAVIIEEAVNNLRELDAGWPLAMALLTAGAIHYRRRRYDEASDVWQTSAALFAQLEDEWGEALCLNRLGEVVRRVGQYDQAKLLYAQSLAMFQELEYPLGLAWVFSNLAVVAREEGDYDHALSLLGDSLRLSQANRRYQAVCICLTISGQIKLLQGNYREAYPLCQEAYELASERGDELSAAFSARYLGHISLETAKFAQAERFYTASQAAFWRAGDISGVATSYAHLAEVARQQSNWEAAEQLARQGIKQADSDRKNLFTDMLELMAALARIYADTQQPERAARLLAFVRAQGMGRQVVLDKMHYCEQLIAPALSAAQQTAAAEWSRQQSVESVLDWLEPK